MLGLTSSSAFSIGTEIAYEAEKLGTELHQKYPKALVVAGQLIFEEDTVWNRVLHNESKLAAMDSFIDRFFPGRAKAIRPPTAQEIKAITILEMEIEDAAGAKIRSTGVSDDEEDYAGVPVSCAVHPIRTVLGEPEECPRQLPGVTPEAGGMSAYQPRRRLDEVLPETYRRTYPSET